ISTYNIKPNTLFQICGMVANMLLFGSVGRMARSNLNYNIEKYIGWSVLANKTEFCSKRYNEDSDYFKSIENDKMVKRTEEMSEFYRKISLTAKQSADRLERYIQEDAEIALSISLIGEIPDYKGLKDKYIEKFQTLTK
ncbi:hypothetical protein ACFL1H_08175, partial [Nanoarchaeota archaeon]